MRSVTIKNAKAHLNELVDAAVRGEQVVLMRGAKHVAAIVPITEEELEIAPRLTDEQASRFWAQLREERDAAKILTFESAADAVSHLRARRVRAVGRSRRTTKR